MIRSLSLASLFLAFVSFSSAPAQAKMVEVTGIGVNVDLTDGHLIIQGLIKDAPAEKSGLLMAKDEITAVKTTPTSDFVSVVGKTMDDAGALIRGAEGVPVSLHVKRAGVSDELTVTIVRAKFMVDDGQ